MTEKGTSFDPSQLQLSERMRAMIEKQGGVVPGVGRVELPEPKPATEKENKEDLIKNQVTNDVLFVLMPNPGFTREGKPDYDEGKRNEYRKKIGEAKERLMQQGVNVDEELKKPFLIDGNKDTYGNRKLVLLEIVEKMRNGEDLNDKEKVIVDRIKLKPEDLTKETKEVLPKEEEVVQRPIEKSEPVVEPVRKSRLNIQTEEQLNTKMLEYRGITDPQTRARMLRELGKHLYDNGRIDWGNTVIEEANRQMERANTSKIEGLPDDLESDKDWRKWVRTRLASFLDPSVGEVMSARNVFSIITEQNYSGMVTRSEVNGTNYMKSADLRDELLDGKRTFDGRIVETSELQACQEIAKLYTDWRSAHGNLKNLISALESGTYKLPDVKLTKKIFNGLRSEDGSDPEGGSKLVSRAVQLYWAMAHNKEPEGKKILKKYGLKGLKNIFDTQLSVAETAEIRSRVAEKSGGAYYENLGLMYASFLGISSYGSDSTLPGIIYVDRMGTLIHTEVNRFDNDKDKYDVNKKKYRFLHDKVAKVLYEVKNGKAVIGRDGKPVPVEIGVHTGTLQSLVEAKQPRAFYVLKPKGSSEKYRIVKKIGLPGTDTAVDPDAQFLALNKKKYDEVLFEDLVKEGRLNEIDWEKGYDAFSVMKSREGDGLEVYKMFKNLDDSIDKLTEDELIKRKDNFESAMPQYNLETQKHTMFLWMYSLIAKNRSTWTTGDKSQPLKYMIDDMVNHGLITENYKARLYKEFDLNWYRDTFKMSIKAN